MLIFMPYSPRQALQNTLFHASNIDSLQPHPHPHQYPERKQLVPRRTVHSQKRQRIDLHPEIPTAAGSGREGGIGQVKNEIDLSPCHICWRKPTEKAQLDCYAYCEGCGERACYVCLRECHGLNFGTARELGDGMLRLELQGGGDEGRRPWVRAQIEGHRGRICSRCCVERGADGEPWCLGCLKAEEWVS